jgi:hypothetical protein
LLVTQPFLPKPNVPNEITYPVERSSSRSKDAFAAKKPGYQQFFDL